MNTTLCQDRETKIVEAAGMRELIKGLDQQLIQRVAPMLRAESIVLDLGNVDRIDAAGIAALISLYTGAHHAGHEFSVCNVNGRVAEILRLVGLDNILVSHNAVPGSHSGDCYRRSAA